MSSGLPLYQQFINFLFSSGAIEVKEDFHEQCNQIKKMIANDVSGVVSTVTDYSINSASEAKFRIECSDETTEDLLNLWLQQINVNIDGIPTGLQELAKEYYKERWAGSSLCLMRIGVWKKINIGNNSITVPTVLWFVNGASVYVKRINPDSFKLGTDTFYFDEHFKKEIKTAKEEILVNKPFSRVFDQYPSPYLVKKGVLQNFLAVEKLSSKSNQVIQKFIPYLFELEKGDKESFLKDLSECDDPTVKEAVNNFKTAMERYESEGSKTPIAAHTFDQKFTHLIPDLTKILNEELYKQSYRALLAGLGFMTVVQGVGDTRKEETITPKPFIAEVNAGVADFKTMLMDVIRLIIDQNKIDHRKLFSENKELQITNSPIKINVQSMLDAYRSAFIYGAISYTTYQEVLDINPDQELERANKEWKNGLRDIYYPHIISNQEDKGLDTAIPTTKKQNEKQTEKEKKPTTTNKAHELVECENCKEKIDYLSIQEKGMGYIECPKCGKNIDQTGKCYAALKEFINDQEITLKPGKYANAVELHNEKTWVRDGYCEFSTEEKGYIFDENFSVARLGVDGYIFVSKKDLKENLEIAPYKNIEDLEKTHPNLKYLPDGAKQTFIDVFNKNYLKGEDYAFPVAYTAMKRWLKKHGYIKNKDGKWVKKEEK